MGTGSYSILTCLSDMTVKNFTNMVRIKQYAGHDKKANLM